MNEQPQAKAILWVGVPDPDEEAFDRICGISSEEIEELERVSGGYFTGIEHGGKDAGFGLLIVEAYQNEDPLELTASELVVAVANSSVCLRDLFKRHEIHDEVKVYFQADYC